LDALGEVYDMYGAVVYGVALKVTGERAEAEALTREVFLDLWRHPERFDPSRSPLRPWLAMLAHRRAVEAVRARAAPSRQGDGMVASSGRVLDLDEIMQSIIRAEEVRAALAALPEDQRTAIRLAYFAGKTYQQVAAALDLPEDTVKARMCSGLRRVASSVHVAVVEEER
jgi:RNA polymerase sigma factor (sigma-70 family)